MKSDIKIRPSIDVLCTYVGRQVVVTILRNGGKMQRVYGTLEKYSNLLSVCYRSACANRLSFRPILNVDTRALAQPFDVFVDVKLVNKDETSATKTQNKMLLLCEV